jgi:DNA-binding MarR family transcriptional regulator
MMRLTNAIERIHQATELRAQAVDLLRRADALEHMAAGQHQQHDPGCAPASGHFASELLDDAPTATQPLVSLATNIARSRQQREQYFPQDIFGEPGWDILLDLYTLDADGRGVSVTNASLAGNTPPTTGLRWLKLLEQKGLVSRLQSERDRRVTWVRLTSSAQARMHDYLMGRSRRSLCEINTYTKHR